MTGRPTAFKKEYQQIALKMCKMGATDKDLAEAFGVTEQTINNWKTKHPQFFESLKLGKEESDDLVEQALFQRAVGYKHKETKFFAHQGVVMDQKTVDVHYPPDTRACEAWLYNRRPKDWSRKQQIEVSGESLADVINALSPHKKA